MTSINHQNPGPLNKAHHQRHERATEGDMGRFLEMVGKMWDKDTSENKPHKKKGGFEYIERMTEEKRDLNIKLKNGINVRIHEESKSGMRALTSTGDINDLLEKQKKITHNFEAVGNERLREILRILMQGSHREEDSDLSLKDKIKGKKRLSELNQPGKKEISDNVKKPEETMLDEKTTEQLSVEKETDIKESEKKESGKNDKMLQEMLKQRVMKDIVKKMFD
tara:strand:+ start:63 stop:731 length:669 start_codon:yes stop_codon:yes gene_type:complete